MSEDVLGDKEEVESDNDKKSMHKSLLPGARNMADQKASRTRGKDSA